MKNSRDKVNVRDKFITFCDEHYFPCDKLMLLFCHFIGLLVETQVEGIVALTAFFVENQTRNQIKRPRMNEKEIK